MEYPVAGKMNKDYLHVRIGDNIENTDVPYMLFIYCGVHLFNTHLLSIPCQATKMSLAPSLHQYWSRGLARQREGGAWG